MKKVTQKFKADDIYKNLLKKDPSLLEAQINKAFIELKHFRNYPLVVSILNGVLAAKDNHLNKQTMTTINLQLAEAYLAQKNFIDAHSRFLSALKIAPDFDESLALIQDLYLKKEYFKEFASLLDSARVEIPGQPILYAMLGETYNDYLSNYREAVRHYKNAILLDPDQVHYYSGIGVAYYHLKEYEFALKAFKAALKVDPNDSLATYNEACLLAKLGRPQEAVLSLNKAFSLDPNLKVVAAQDEDLTSVRGMIAPSAPSDGQESLLSH